MVKEYDGNVRVVYKHFVVHPDTAMSAHLASCAAGKQGKFIEFKRVFWDKGFGAYAKTRDPSTMAEDAILKMAGEIGLNRAQLASDMQGQECKDRIASDRKELDKFRVNGTPSFFVNGKFTMFSGPDAFKKIIDAELAAVKESGVAPGEYYDKVVMAKGEKTFRSKKDAKNSPPR